MSEWYALRVMTRQEGFVARALAEQDEPLVGYVPQHVTEARFARRKATRSRPLIPGYVLARLPDDEAIQAALAIRGVIHEGRLIRVRAIDVGAIVLLDACHAFDETWKPPKRKGGPRYTRRYKPGDRVKVEDGPFAGFPGEVVKLKNKNRLDVVVVIFGRATEIDLEERQLTPDVACSIAA